MSDAFYNSGPTTPPPTATTMTTTTTSAPAQGTESVGDVVTDTFSFPAMIFNFLREVGRLLIVVITILWAFLYFLWSWRSLVLFYLLIFGASYVFYNEYGVIASAVEHFQRCVLYPNWINWYGPLVQSVVGVYDYVICWTNALGQINRLLTGTLFVKIFESCPGVFDLFVWLKLMGEIVGDLIRNVTVWAFDLEPFEVTLPMWGLANRTLTELIPLTGAAFVCLCGDLQMLTTGISRVASSTDLPCLFHQFINVIIGYYQALVVFIFDMLTLIRTVIFGGGTPATIKSLLTVNGSTVQVLANLDNTAMLERVNSASVYLWRFLNFAFSSGYCTVVAQIDASGIDANNEPVYQACMADPANRPQLFCIVGNLVAILDRCLRLAATLLWHLPQVLEEAQTQPAGPRWLIDTWWAQDWAIVFATIRDPPQLYNYSTSLNFPVPLPPVVNPILFPNPDLYGPDVIQDCDFFNNSVYVVPCAQCPEVEDLTVKVCLCATATSLDQLTQPLIGITIWGPTVCCFASNVLTLVADILNWSIGAVVHVINFDRLGAYVADQNGYDIIFNDLAGTPYVMGGVLDCVNQMLIGLDSRLESLSGMVTTVLKSIMEACRLAFVAGVRVANTIVGTGEPGFNDYICVTDFNNCVDLERTLLWLRKPRADTIIYDPTYAYSPILNFYPNEFIDWFCYFLDYQLFQAFTGTPAGPLPNICCIVDYIFRLIVEIGKMEARAIIGIYQTFAPILSFKPPVLINVLMWGCTNTTTCNNFGAIISDLSDLLDCPCELLFEIESAITPGQDSFPCMCNILTGVAQSFTNIFRAGAVMASAAFQVVDCYENNDTASSNCGLGLSLRFESGFNDIYDSLDGFSLTAAGLGCLTGLPWVFIQRDCQGLRYTWPLDYPPCNISKNILGPGMVPCTMSDRLQMIFYYVANLVATVIKFIVQLIQSAIDEGLQIVLPGHVPLPTGHMGSCINIANFLLDVGVALFGNASVVVTVSYVNNTFDNTNSSGFNSTTTLNNLLMGMMINETEFYIEHPDAMSNPYPYVTFFLNYTPTMSYTSQTTVINFTNLSNVNATTGLIESIGYGIDCLLGPGSSPGCVGPLIFGPSQDPGKNPDCFGWLVVIGGYLLRDLWPLGVAVENDVCLLFSDLFSNSAGGFLSDLIQLVKDIFAFLGAFLSSGTGAIILAFAALIDFMSGFIYGPFMTALFEFGTGFIKNTFVQFEFMVTYQEVASYFGFKKRGESGAFDFDPRYDYAGIGSDPNRALIDLMTPGTYCQDALSTLIGYDTLNLANKAIWNICYFAAALPIIISNRTNGELQLPPDFFYNVDTFLNTTFELLDVLSTYTDYRSNMPGITAITQYVKVPQHILNYAEAQLALQELASGITPEQLSFFSVVLNVTNLTSSELMDYAVEEIQIAGLFTANGSSSPLYSKKREGLKENESRSLLDSVRYFSRYRSSPVGFDHVPTNSFENKEPEHCGVQGTCIDVEGLFGGFVLEYGRETEELLSARYVEKKRGFIEALGGSAIAENAAYNANSQPGDPPFDPFYQNTIKLFTSLNGGLVLNLTKTGQLIPVVNGKIAVTRNMTFLDYLEENGLNKSLHMWAVSSYEKAEVNVSQKKFLKFHAAGSMLSSSDIFAQDQQPSQTVAEPQPLPNRKRNFPPPHWTKARIDNVRDAYYESVKNLPHEHQYPGLNQNIRTLFSTWEKYQRDRIRVYGGSSDSVTSNWGVGAAFQKIANGFDFLKSIWKGTGEAFSEGGAFDYLEVSAVADHGSLDHDDLEPASRKRGLSRDKRTLLPVEESILTGKRFKVMENVHEMSRRRSPNETDFWGGVQHYFSFVVWETWFGVAKSWTGYNAFYFDNDGNKRKAGAVRPVEKEDVWYSDARFRESSELGRFLATRTSSEDVYVHADGRKYGAEDEAYIIYDPTGRPKLYSQAEFELKEVFGRKVTPIRKNVSDHQELAEVEKRNYAFNYIHPADPLEHQLLASVPLFKELPSFDKKRDAMENWKRNLDSRSASFRVKVNYYEHNALTRDLARPCLGGISWKERLFFDSNRPERGPSFLNSTEHAEWSSRAENKKRFRTDDSDVARSSELVLVVRKCYRQKTDLPIHPHQKKYGHILQGKSLFYHRWEMAKNATAEIWNDIAEKLSLPNIIERFKEVHGRPWVQKYKNYITVTGKRPPISTPFVLYEKIRSFLLGKGNKRFAIPEVFWTELGHRITFFDSEGTPVHDPEQYAELLKKWSEMQWSDLLFGNGTSTGGDLGESESKKRQSNFPPLLDMCLPSQSNATTCLDCYQCLRESAFEFAQCYYCNLCNNCTDGGGGNFTCTSCDACRVGRGLPYCQGTCTSCTNCTTQSSCLNCTILQIFIGGAWEAIDFCYQLDFLNNTDVLLKPAPNSTLFEIVYMSPNSSAPSLSNYGGWSGFFKWFGDWIFWAIGKILGGVDILGTFEAFMLTTNINPFSGMFVGFEFWLQQTPIPFVGTCTRDINLMCAYGLGFETALYITAITIFFMGLGLVVGLDFPAAIILSIMTFPAFATMMIGTLAWLWNPICQANAYWSLFSLLGWTYTTFPMFPVCAGDQIYAWLNKTITPNASYIPADFYFTANGSNITSCAQYVNPNITLECQALGFNSTLSGLSYVLQRYLPSSARYWMVTYINTTALVRGDCKLVLAIPLAVLFLLLVAFNLPWILALLAVAAIGLGLTFGLDLHGNCFGILYPLYSFNFQDSIIQNGTAATDPCFYASVAGLILAGSYVIFFLMMAWLALLLLLAFVGFLGAVLMLPPFSWYFDTTAFQSKANFYRDQYMPVTPDQREQRRQQLREDQQNKRVLSLEQKLAALEKKMASFEVASRA
jgi:hypothetical protein